MGHLEDNVVVALLVTVLVAEGDCRIRHVVVQLHLCCGYQRRVEELAEALLRLQVEVAALLEETGTITVHFRFSPDIS